MQTRIPTWDLLKNTDATKTNRCSKNSVPRQKSSGVSDTKRRVVMGKVSSERRSVDANASG